MTSKMNLPVGLTLFFTFASLNLHAETTPPSPKDIASSQVVGRTIAIVNNDPIFEEEFERESEPLIDRYKKTAPEQERTPEKIETLKKEILNRMIEEKLLLQESKNKKIRATRAEVEREMAQFKQPFLLDAEGKQRPASEVEKAFQDQLLKEGLTQEQFSKRVEEQIMKVRLIDQEVKSKVSMPTEEEAKNLFDMIQKKMTGKPVEGLTQEDSQEMDQIVKYLQRMSGEQVHIRHVLVRTSNAAEKSKARKKIEEVLQKIKKGEDFTFLAKKYSEDPLTRDRGGDLGFVAQGDLGLPPIDQVIFKMTEGEVSGIIETEIGFHVVKMIEKKAPHPVEYQDVSDDLKNYLARKNFTQKLEKYIKTLRSKASITIKING
jgi:parvulin-like peptidyl-prolyl isomerase